ncbi:MAG: AAA family ATPase [Deltaproteobacteria bacterium]|nr:AAA family ATPase [Deltaproteobacteria bacterium]
MAKEKNRFNVDTKRVTLDDLYLDPNNYRLIHETAYEKVCEKNINNNLVQSRTFKLITKEKNQNISDLIDSFKSNGYLPVDQIQVRLLDGGGYVVVEGNRRIAALKHLKNNHEENKIDLNKLDSNIFNNVPVVLYEDGDEMHYLTLMGLKHISGNKKWGEWNQAKLLEKLSVNHQLSEDDICKQVAISKTELRRSLRALSFIKQYIISDYGDQFDESKFSLFREIVRNSKLKAWLKWNEEKKKALHTENTELFFSWISKEPNEEEDEEEDISYADKYKEPALTKRDDIRTLSKIINDPKAIERLKETRNITETYSLSDIVFRERQKKTIEHLTREIDTLEQMTIEQKRLPEIESALGRLKSIIDKSKVSDPFGGVEAKTVFFDRLDNHFSELVIPDYKRLQNIKISRLSRINLFTGINNSGKTTLLEAVYLLCRQNDFSGLFETIRRRGKISKERLNTKWFVEQLPKKLEIQGNFDNKISKLIIQRREEQNAKIDRARYLESVEINAEYMGKKQKSLTRIFKESRETKAKSIKILCPSVFSSPFFLNEPHRYASFYHKSVQSKALPKILEFIKTNILTTLEDIRLVDEWQRFLVSDQQYPGAIDITRYGEGILRIFFISLLFASAQNGVILIDEFENAIHTELISSFTKFICELSEIFNTQVFLTTHSKECIDAFVKNEFGGKEFKKLIEAGNVDLRKAR